MSGFRVGDVVIAQNLVEKPCFNGAEGEVIKVCENWPAVGATTGRKYLLPIAYRVAWRDGSVSAQAPHELRLKRPPSWDKWIYDTSDVDSHEPVSA